MRLNFFRIVLAGLVLLSIAISPSFGQGKPAPAGKVCKNAAGVAADGYDVVSYFTEKKAERGSALIALRHDGAEYRFVSVVHREKFAANPEAFLPQYGGHCAYGMSKGKAIPGDPQNWLIHKGKLYLTSSRDALGRLQSEALSVIEQANEFWRQLY
jgi:YHS domain-containing protein